MSTSYPQFLGRYRVIGVLGKGAMGMVFRAIDPDISREVAIKTLWREREGAATPPESLLKLLRAEAQAAGKLRHPNIVTIYEAETSGPTPFLVMEYVEGETLRERLHRRGALPLAEAIRIVSEICSAVDYAHGMGLLHRDLKPSNILLDHKGQVRVLDFGVASASLGYADWEMPQAVPRFVGTPGYLSPEQILHEGVDQRADIFAIGVIAFECFSGARPFQGVTTEEVMSRTVSDPTPSLTSLRREIPLGIEAVIERALAKDPGRRFASAKQLADALVEGGKGAAARGALTSDVVSPPPQPPQRVEPPLVSEGKTVAPSLWPSAVRSGASPAAPLGDIPVDSGVIVRAPPPSPLIRFLTGGLLLAALVLVAAILWVMVADTPHHVSHQEFSGRSGTTPVFIPVEPFPPIPTAIPQPGKELRELTDNELAAMLLRPDIEPQRVFDCLIVLVDRAPEVQIALLVHLLNHDSYLVRIEALRHLARLRDVRTLGYVAVALDDPDPLVRGFAARAIGAISDPRGRELLRQKLLTEPDLAVKSALERAIE